METALLPVTVLGTAAFAVKFVTRSRGEQNSMTAYEPAFARLMMHLLGKCEDEAGERLILALPAVSRRAVRAMLGPTVLASRLSGVTIAMYDYPIYRSTSIWTAFGHRTRFFDDAWSSWLDEVDQVVVLGAGWDTRCYGLLRNARVSAYEVDTEATQRVKRAALRRAGIEHDEVVFVSADFGRESWLDALQRSGFDHEKPTFVLWEGVTYYLDERTVEETLRTVATRLAPGSAIAFDYPARRILEGRAGLTYRMTRWLARRIGEPWTFGIQVTDAAESELGAFLQHAGLWLANHEVVGDIADGQPPDGGLAVASNRRPAGSR